MNNDLAPNETSWTRTRLGPALSERRNAPYLVGHPVLTKRAPPDVAADSLGDRSGGAGSRTGSQARMSRGCRQSLIPSSAVIASPIGLVHR